MAISAQENNTLTATITTQVNGQDIPVLNVSANLNSGLTGFMFNVNIVNTQVAKSNATDVQTQLDNYIADTLKSKMIDMGYPIILK